MEGLFLVVVENLVLVFIFLSEDNVSSFYLNVKVSEEL